MIPAIDLPVDLPSLQTKVLLTAAGGDAPDAAAEQELSALLHATLQGLRDPDPERRRSWALVLRRVGEVLGEVGSLLYSGMLLGGLPQAPAAQGAPGVGGFAARAVAHLRLRTGPTAEAVRTLSAVAHQGDPENLLLALGMLAGTPELDPQRTGAVVVHAALARLDGAHQEIAVRGLISALLHLAGAVPPPPPPVPPEANTP